MRRFRAAGLGLALMLCVAAASPVGSLGSTDDASATQVFGAEEASSPPSAQPVVYTALGDSIATGIWARSGYVGVYSEHLRTDVAPSVQLTNLAVNGWTTSDLLAALRSNDSYRNAVRSADVVTVSIGGNDLLLARGRFMQGACGGTANADCLRETTDRILVNWDSILDEILEIVGPRPAAIRTMDVYNPYAGVDAARLSVLKPYLDEINAYICLSAELRGIPCARVYAAFNGPDGDGDPVQQALIAFDGIHPSDSGHALIADLLRDVGYAPLR
jgi:lysophospholipase L1-like esterase